MAQRYPGQPGTPNIADLIHGGYSTPHTGKKPDQDIYQNRPRISSQSERVQGGVYYPEILAGRMEATVVDYQADAGLREYIAALETFLLGKTAELRAAGRNVDFETLLKIMSHKIAADFPYDKNMVEGKVTNYPPGKKVHLSVIMQKQNMICRHMGLLAAAILDKFIYAPNPKGVRIVQPCQVRFMADTQHDLVEDENNGHAYVVVKYQEKTGELKYYVIDPAGGRAVEAREFFKKQREPGPAAYRYMFSMMRFLFQNEDSRDNSFIVDFFKRANADKNAEGIIQNLQTNFKHDPNVLRRISQLKTHAAL